MEEKVYNIIKNNKKWIIALISLLLFIILLINVLNENIMNFDINIYKIVISLKSVFFDVFFRSITRFGDEEILILLVIFCFIFIKNKKNAGSIAINLASVGLINYILKKIIQRPRPPIEYRMIEESSFSFPSGHAMVSMAFYGLVIYYIVKNVKNKRNKNVACLALSILIFLIGISRVYLGVHYASDVLAGFLFGIIYLVIYITIMLKLLKIK